MCTPAPRGTGKCFAELYRRVAAVRPHWHIVLYHRGSPAGGAWPPSIETRRIEMRGDRWALWERVRLPLAARAASAALLHCPANTAPPLPLSPLLLTVHDLIPLQREFASAESARWGAVVARAARAARRITTPSEYSKRQIMETFGVSAGKIIVHPWAPHPNCRPEPDCRRLNDALTHCGLDAGRPYVLAFGGNDPRKNTRRMLQAWASLGPADAAGAVLLVVGMQNPLLARLSGEFAGCIRDRRCVLAGYVSEPDLTVLLAGAELLCYPSLSEGFGLPVLDAFACHTPVLTSRETSIPEVAGEAVHYVDPRSVESIARGLRLLLSDDTVRAALAVRGAERVRAFTWDRCVRRFCRAVEECAGATA